jgi:hypothetical protein
MSGQISSAAVVAIAASRVGATFAGPTLPCATFLALIASGLTLSCATFLALTASSLTLTTPVTAAVPVAPGFASRPALPLSTRDRGHDHCRRDNDYRCGN